MNDFAELGYTPKNLRALINSTGLSVESFSVKYQFNKSGLYKSLRSADDPAHVSISYKRWVTLCGLVSSSDE